MNQQTPAPIDPQTMSSAEPAPKRLGRPLRSPQPTTGGRTRRALSQLALCCLSLLLLGIVAESASAKGKHSRRSSKHREIRRPSHTTSEGPGWWIHRDGDKPLGWLFGEQLNRARKNKEAVIVMFTADWCSPCKAIKEFVAGSGVVRRAFRKHKGRLLYIDVDEWRGPAHRLIPGVNPRKLPTLVRIDRSGQKVIVAYGSSLGLLSEDAVATNFGRLIDGKPMAKPFYEGDSAKQTMLIRAQHAAREARNHGTKELIVTRLTQGTVRLRLRNLDGPRRWYLIPLDNTVGLVEQPTVSLATTMKFDEHVRATYLRFEGKHGFIAMPVAGYGDIDLIGLPLRTSGKTLEVWQLNRLVLDGETQQFNRKLPYHQRMTQAGAASIIGSRPVKAVKLFVKRKMKVRVR